MNLSLKLKLSLIFQTGSQIKLSIATKTNILKRLEAILEKNLLSVQHVYQIIHKTLCRSTHKGRKVNLDRYWRYIQLNGIFAILSGFQIPKDY